MRVRPANYYCSLDVERDVTQALDNPLRNVLRVCTSKRHQHTSSSRASNSGPARMVRKVPPKHRELRSEQKSRAIWPALVKRIRTIKVLVHDHVNVICIEVPVVVNTCGCNSGLRYGSLKVRTE